MEGNEILATVSTLFKGIFMLKLIRVWLLVILGIGAAALPAWAGNNSGAAFSHWPDTGQTKCYNDTVEIPCPAEGSAFYGQDAQYAGLARSYKDLGSGMIQDNVTGLVWEQKTNFDAVANYADPHDADNQYTWCDPDPNTNGGDQGACGDHDTKDFIDQLNNDYFGGYNDWRMPTIKELASLVDWGRWRPAIDPVFAATTNVGYQYFSSTTTAGWAGAAYNISFAYGGIDGNNTTGTTKTIDRYYYARAVRGGQSPSLINRFVDNNDGTVSDIVTGLMWQQATAGPMNWQAALAYAEGLGFAGHNDWRLPTVNELISMMDYSRSPNIDVSFFPDTKCDYDDHYWSSTTNLLHEGWVEHDNYAWQVNYYYSNTQSHVDKPVSNSNYVRCVRGTQSVALGTSGSFVFDPINSPVQSGTCFPVRVEARSASNVLDTSVNGDVSLDANYGFIYPLTLSFSNGVAANSCVKVYWGGENKQLRVQGHGRLGQSNYFSTTGAGSCSGQIEIKTGSGATVELYNSASGLKYGQDDVNFFNVAVFKDVPCGSYFVKIGKDGFWHHDNNLVSIDYPGSAYARTIPLPSSGAKKRAVILIPGMLGSTHRGVPNAAAPYLKGNFPDKDLIINSSQITGWDRLQSGLEADGYTVITCPWDWRSESKESMKKNVETFLIPAIDNARQYSSDGKVDIVAHSMGGLLARAYIQSDLYNNRKDVAKLALVAVPNQGSANPYFLWEGGDTKTTKKVLNTIWDKILGNTYVETIQNLWQKTYRKNNWRDCDAIHIKEFLDKYGPGMLQLMSTEKFLTKNGSPYSVAASGNVNNWLKALNNGSSGFASPENVFSHTDNQKVLTRVFLGNISSSTLREIGVGTGAGSLYPDGQPEGAGSLDCSDTEPTGLSMLKGAGDTTVPLESAQYPVAQGWADRAEKTSLVKHGTIVKDFRDEIIDFLNGEAGTTTLESESQAKIATAKALMGEEVTPALAFSVIGNMRLLVTDSQGRRSGIVPVTGEVVDEIPETKIEANDAAASVMIESPAAGEYNLTYYGPNDGDFFLAVSAYNAAGEMAEKSFKGYRPDGAQTMIITYNPATSEQFVVQPVVLAPQEMETEPYACATGQCVRLKWKASQNAGVTEYIVYRALEEEPFYTELKRVPAGTTSYNTGEVWDGSSGFPVNGYAVSAIKADTKESFFAEEKGVIKKTFPWTMFLPAITHKVQ